MPFFVCLLCTCINSSDGQTAVVVARLILVILLTFCSQLGMCLRCTITGSLAIFPTIMASADNSVFGLDTRNEIIGLVEDYE